MLLFTKAAWPNTAGLSQICGEKVSLLMQRQTWGSHWVQRWQAPFFLKFGNKITCQCDICCHIPLAEFNCRSEPVTTCGPSDDSGCLGLCDTSLRLQRMASVCWQWMHSFIHFPNSDLIHPCEYLLDWGAEGCWNNSLRSYMAFNCKIYHHHKIIFTMVWFATELMIVPTDVSHSNYNGNRSLSHMWANEYYSFE